MLEDEFDSDDLNIPEVPNYAHRVVKDPWEFEGRKDAPFAELPREYLQNPFNLVGLESMVPNFWKALELLVGQLDPDTLSDTARENLFCSADFIYGMCHVRYVTTGGGMGEVLGMCTKKVFGTCPRLGCHGVPVMPCATTDRPFKDTMKVYCCKCCDLYEPTIEAHSKIDGAYYGTSLPHMIMDSFIDVQYHLSTKSSSGNSSRSDSSGSILDYRYSNRDYKWSFENDESSNYNSDISYDCETASPMKGKSYGCGYTIKRPQINHFNLNYRCPYVAHRQWLRWRSSVSPGEIYPQIFNNPKSSFKNKSKGKQDK